MEMSEVATQTEVKEALGGAALGAQAFLLWGLSPLYWKLLIRVPALEIILHRVVWSFLFLVPLLVIMKRWKELAQALTDRRTLPILLLTSVLVSGNWLLYIWAVNAGHVLQSSLGYYICPLVNVFMGLIFLHEKLRRLQWAAVALAGAGVLYMAIQAGEFPWIALTLAFSFSFYGLIRKMAPVGPLVGLAVETLLLSLPAVAYVLFLFESGQGAYGRFGPGLDLMLMGAALFTALPLLLFTSATKKLHLSTVGFLQYIAPTCMFLLAVFVFKEPFSRAKIISFLFIWAALSIYSADSVLHYRHMESK